MKALIGSVIWVVALFVDDGYSQVTAPTQVPAATTQAVQKTENGGQPPSRKATARLERQDRAKRKQAKQATYRMTGDETAKPPSGDRRSAALEIKQLRRAAMRDNRAKANTPQPLTFAEANRHCVREIHDQAWWRKRYTTIVFVISGYYYWDAGYWFPAWGYDPQFDNYDYDGPIYCYGNLLPDQVIYNVQRALKELGYYKGPLTGSLSQRSRAALAAYQEDAGLDVTGAIDAATVEALGLY